MEEEKHTNSELEYYPKVDSFINNLKLLAQSKFKFIDQVMSKYTRKYTQNTSVLCLSVCVSGQRERETRIKDLI